jgi:hypothetical protein
LSRGTASLARGYGICVRRTKYGQNDCFCRIFSLDGLARTPEGCPKKRAFVGRYGNLLLQGTVFLWRGVRYLEAALFGLVLSEGTVSRRRAASSKTGVLREILPSSVFDRGRKSVADKGGRLSDGTVSAVPEGAIKAPVLSESTVSPGGASARSGARRYFRGFRSVGRVRYASGLGARAVA